MTLKVKIYIVIGILLIVILNSTCSSFKNLYNTSVSYKLDYQKAEQELVTFYDNKYLAFTSKSNIANINKDVFIEVTNIIMSNRKDGEQLAWKWVKENQHIPYEEFTVFYKDLTAFVDKQYDGIFAIEGKKQSIANAHNKLISLFPNNMYNWALNIQPIHYKFGYVSESTRQLFKL